MVAGLLLSLLGVFPLIHVIVGPLSMATSVDVEYIGIGFVELYFCPPALPWTCLSCEYPLTSVAGLIFNPTPRGEIPFQPKCWTLDLSGPIHGQTVLGGVLGGASITIINMQQLGQLLNVTSYFSKRANESYLKFLSR